ncbi:MAG: LysR family transcriptional regulator [Bdellovibrionales bacterium]|nr:LysR family transcriptional regulator [Bdellovibrionales bacterium]
MNTPLGDLDWSALRHFYAVAHFRGFSRASRGTGASQPAISTALRKLERALETPLVVRGPGEFRLTAEGTTLFEFCRRLEGDVSRLFQDLQRKAPVSVERFRFGASLSIGYGPLAPLLKKLAGGPNAMEIEIVSADSHRLLRLLKDGEIDGAFVPEEAGTGAFRPVVTVKDEIAMVGAADRFPNSRPDGPRARIFSTPFITYPSESPMRRLVDRICAKGGLTFTSTISAPTAEAVKTLCARGVGIAFIQRSLVDAELRAGSLKEIPTGLALPKRSIQFVVREGDERLAFRIGKRAGD